MKRNKSEPDLFDLLSFYEYKIQKLEELVRLKNARIEMYESVLSTLINNNHTNMALMVDTFLLQVDRVNLKKKNKKLKLLDDFEAIKIANDKLKIYPKKIMFLSSGLPSPNFYTIQNSYCKTYKRRFKDFYYSVLKSYKTEELPENIKKIVRKNLLRLPSPAVYSTINSKHQ